ncbi:MAG: hypothetical protein AAGI53_15635 [Planctomycetota bacterium]
MGDSGPASELLAAAPDANERFHLLHAFADWAGDAPFLHDWAGRTADPLAHTALLIHGSKLAWDLGPWTHGKSDLLALRDELVRLKDAFLTLGKRDRNSALMMPHLMWVLRGLGDAGAARKVFREGFQRQPELRALYTGGMTTESPQWYGANANATAEFVDKWSGRAPSGIGVETMVLMSVWYQSLDGPESPHEAAIWQDIWTRSRVQQAITSAESAGFTGHNGARTRHYVAYALYWMGEHDRAAVHLRELGPHGAEAPWGRLRFGLSAFFSVYKTARKTCRV